MRFLQSELRFSPSDLTVYHDSPFASWMDRLRFSYPDLAPQPDADEPFQQLLQNLGDRHEHAQLQTFINQGLKVADIRKLCDHTNFDSACTCTIEQMKQGAEVIFQAALHLAPFAGYADFLVKVPGASALGDYHYEVWDTKLASRVKVKFVLQLCCYTEMVAAIQQRMPEHIVVVPGKGKIQRLRLYDFYGYYQRVKTDFIAVQNRFSADAAWPDPYQSNEYGRWSSVAEQYFEEHDHLSLIANITRRQVQKLQQAGILSRQQLVDCATNTVTGLHSDIVQRLVQQARLQLESASLDIPKFEVLTPSSDQPNWLAYLPERSRADIYFDLEGFPLLEGGLEYLWGAGYTEQGHFQFKAWWAHNEAEEATAFQNFIQWAYQRWQAQPEMHIYHYGHYEITALRRLMGKYGCCETELDTLLRQQVFVDLYPITRNSLRIGEPKYSIKNVERNYRPKRKTEVATGGDSLVEYQQWRDLESVGADGRDEHSSAILQNIWSYNKDDCESTWQLACFLSDIARQHGIVSQVRPVTEVSDKTQAQQQRLAKQRQQLLQRADELQGAEQQACETMAWLVEFYQREKKPVFWRIFDLKAKDEAELIDEPDVIVGCRLESHADGEATICFDPEQELQQPRAKQLLVCAPEVSELLTVNWSGFDGKAGYIFLQTRKSLPATFQLIPFDFVNAKVLEEALFRASEAFLQQPKSPPLAMQLLLRAKPRFSPSAPGLPIKAEQPAARLREISDCISALNQSYLTIQGPPGTGKTYTAARAIADLIQQGKKVAITANSHKALQHLLLAAKKQLNERDADFKAVCVSTSGDELNQHGIRLVESNTELLKHLDAPLVAATAFVLAKIELKQHFDVLFVDEAGQVSLANLLSVTDCCKNLVLLGDQMQLSQPIQACHPGLSGLSGLDYLMEGYAVVPEDRGILLDCSYRMHPAIAELISRCIYQGKLGSDQANTKQTLLNFSLPDGRPAANGVIYCPVEHQGNTTSSEEEVSLIQQLCQQLLGQPYQTKEGDTYPLSAEDIMVITPYNLQVFKLKEALPADIRVGTVDKFQGQEAPVVIVSLCSSDPDASPRGRDFLFDPRRLNVAISRAKALSLIIASPSLLAARAKNLKQIRDMSLLLNLKQN
ncbi:TM0106 family RecB-like putative nuclease [Rheinheimera sp.]|uniref:TM0106 family RecB-like putative nuclease n=1 Tax=Rheinheimera sp. TaxID=1869214 RepID=UPI00404891E2